MPGTLPGDLIERHASGDPRVERLDRRHHRDRHHLIAGLADQPRQPLALRPDDDDQRLVGEVRAATGAAAYLHPDDRVLWDRVYDEAPDRELVDGESLPVGDVDLHVLHTPGHAPGACCFYAPDLEVVFSGDTLFQGGPGATGRSFSDFPTIIESVSGRLFALPDETVVLTGHGDATTIGAERPHLQDWIDRGH